MWPCPALSKAVRAPGTVLPVQCWCEGCLQWRMLHCVKHWCGGGNRKVPIFQGTKITSVQNSHSRKEINVFKRRQSHQYISCWESTWGLLLHIGLWFSERWTWSFIPVAVAFLLHSLPLLSQLFLFVKFQGSSCELVEAPDCSTPVHNIQCRQTVLESSD